MVCHAEFAGRAGKCAPYFPSPLGSFMIAPTETRVHSNAPHPKNFPPLVKQFLDYLKLEKHFSDYTVKSYGADLVQFCQFLVGQIGSTAQSQRFDASLP